MADPIYPDYDFTFVVEQLLFEQGTIVVKYIPVDTRFTAYSYVIPILPDINLNDMKNYVKTWAPKDRWFAQEMILNNESALMGATS